MEVREPAQAPYIKKFVVPATILLSFISFWRAAAIVLADLGSSAYYAGGIAEQAIGKAGPWFILGIMLLSYAVRAVYTYSGMADVAVETHDPDYQSAVKSLWAASTMAGAPQA